MSSHKINPRVCEISLVYTIMIVTDISKAFDHTNHGFAKAESVWWFPRNMASTLDPMCKCQISPFRHVSLSKFLQTLQDPTRSSFVHGTQPPIISDFCSYKRPEFMRHPRCLSPVMVSQVWVTQRKRVNMDRSIVLNSSTTLRMATYERWRLFKELVKLSKTQQK